MATQSSSSCVYVQDDAHGWLPANVLSYEGNVAKVSVSVPSKTAGELDTKVDREVDLTKYESNALPLQNVDEGGNMMELADMCDLPSLHEAAILYNLKTRHVEKKPYTRVGDIIIAVNPFQWIEGLYSDDTRELYVDRLIWNAGPDGDCRAGLDPHVYETSSLAYRGLAIDGHHQSILVSGESGAGKTETVKIVMSHLASVQSAEFEAAGKEEQKEHISHDPRGNVVVKRVLDSNPLLEAFGNAKTVRNDNSSRFGKYIQLQFDVEDATSAAFKGKAVPSCILAGSTCETYLLEKSRVVGHEAKERTYHIFYQLISAPEDVKADIWGGLSGMDNASFAYVGETDTVRIEGRTDAEKWQRTVDALAVINVAGDKLRTLMRAVCTVMQLGNLTFDVDPSDDERCVITAEDELAKLVDLIGVETEDVKQALTTRTITARKETYTVPLKVDAARDSRNAFAKEIYQQIFDWLVRTINNATSAECNYGDASDVEEFGIIGLLDIFGFESFEVNRYEQLCINYANEKLQQKYTVDIFRSVQEEYEYEGIELGEVSFSDNADVLNLVEGRLGIYAVLNEECVRPNGNDTSFVSKVKTMNKDVSCLISEKLHRPTEFAISHYAGTVKYDATSFVEKNMDKLPNDLLECACKSSNDLIRTELKSAADAKAQAPKTGRGKKASSLTVSTKFRTQLASLMHNLGTTRTRYIRCIKPNPEKRPIEMNLRSSNEQLLCAGVISAVKVTRSAFPNRLMHETALQRFRCLSSVEVRHDMDEKKEETEADGTALRDSVVHLMDELLKGMEKKGDDGDVTKAYCCGKSRVYFRSGALEYLESERLSALGVLATAIERIARGFTARSKFLKLKAAAIFSQAMARGTLAKKAFMRARLAAIGLSCWVRCIFAKRELIRRRREKACTLIQKRCRILLAKAIFILCRSSAVIIQKIARGARQRPIYQNMLKEAQEEARVNSKLAALQKRLADAEMKWIQADKQRIEAEKRAAGMIPAAEGAPKAVSEDEEKKDEEKALMDESVAMLEYLRKEVFTLRSKNYLLRSDLTEVKEAYQQLAAHSSSVTASYEALKQHAAQLSQQNKALTFKVNAEKREFVDVKKAMNTSRFTYQSELSKLRQELKAKDAAHDAEVAQLKKELAKLKGTEPVEQVTPAVPPPSPRQTSITRAAFNRSSASFSSEAMDDEEVWGNDGYYQLYGRGQRRGYSGPAGSFRRSRRGKFPPQRRPFIPTRSSSGSSSLARRSLPPTTSLSSAVAATSSAPSSLSEATSGIRKVSSKSSLGEAAGAVPKVLSKSSLSDAARGTAPSLSSKSYMAAAKKGSPKVSSSLSAAASKKSSLSKAASSRS